MYYEIEDEADTPENFELSQIQTKTTYNLKDILVNICFCGLTFERKNSLKIFVLANYIKI